MSDCAVGRYGGMAVCLVAVLTALPPYRLTAQELRLSGYLQPRFQNVGDSASFFLRRARVAVESQITPWATFRAQVEMRTIGAPATPPGSPLTISATDLFIRMSDHAWGATVGQFRVPYSLESLLSSTILEATERSRIVGVARRDIGVLVDRRWGDRLLLQAAVVDGEGPNRATNPDNRMAYFVRAVVTPLPGLDVGGAMAAYPDSTGLDAQGLYRGTRWMVRAEYLRTRKRSTDVRTTGWYAVAGYTAVPGRLQLLSRVEQYDPSNVVTTDRSTGYGAIAQYFFKGDDLKLVFDYELFREQGTQVKNNRFVVQLQARFSNGR